MTEKEIEKKYILSEREYLSLQSRFSSELDAEKITQINYYYDTENYSMYKNNGSRQSNWIRS